MVSHADSPLIDEPAVAGSAIPGIADYRVLPDDEFAGHWGSIFLPAGKKEQLVRGMVAGVRLRAEVPFAKLPLHGVVLLSGPPGTGKTTLAKGVADKVARVIQGVRPWRFIEIDPHDLASSQLGRSQRSVTQLFGTVLREQASAGPLIVLFDEVETVFTDRRNLSLETNPVDVHRAVDAALVGLDQLAQHHPDVLLIATSNFAGAIDPALASRADQIVEIGLPELEARRMILEDTIAAVAAKFPGAARLLEPATLDSAAAAADGMDGRRLRKAVAAACAVAPEVKGRPDLVSSEHLLTTLEQIGGQK